MKRYPGETAWRHAKFIGQRYDRYVSPYAMAGRALVRLCAIVARMGVGMGSRVASAAPRATALH